MRDFLDDMASASRLRAQTASDRIPLARLREQCSALAPSKAFPAPSAGLGVIAEIKVRSPAEGKLADHVDLNTIVARAESYVAGGAGVLSVLTEPDRFDGKLEYLSVVADAVASSSVAVMRKDFLVDEYQLFEARAAGADGVLLIARMLDDRQLDLLLRTADDLGLFVLLEAFDQADLVRCANHAQQQVPLGLNCRDLTTLKIDPARFDQLIERFPKNAIKVAESGIHSLEDGQHVKKLGYDFALIGTALMKARCARSMLESLTATSNNVGTSK